MEIFWICASSVVLILVALEVLCRIVNRRGAKSNMAEIASRLEGVLWWGKQRRVWLLHPGSKRRIDFELRIEGEGPSGLRMILDSRYCAQAEFAKAQEVLSQAGIAFDVHEDRIGGFTEIVVECGQDHVLGARAATQVFTRALNVDYDAHIRTCYG